jgi:hypothetical protein
MSYATVEAAVVAVIQKNADFGATGVTVAHDSKGLGKGLDRFCIVSYYADKFEELTIQRNLQTWQLSIDVYVPWRGDLAELEGRIGTEVQKVKDIIGQYPRLDACAGVLKAALTAGAFPDVLTRARGAFRGKRSLLEVQEWIDPGRAE